MSKIAEPDVTFREAMAMACSFLQVEEMYLAMKRHLEHFLNEVIISSARTQSISDPSSDLNKNAISLQNRKKNEQLLVLENNTKVLGND